MKILFQSGGEIPAASLHVHNFVTAKLIQVSPPQSLLTRYRFENNSNMQNLITLWPSFILHPGCFLGNR